MISFAIIGLGNIGIRHANHILNNASAKLVAICDTDVQKSSFANTNDIPFYTEVDTMLQSIQADVICICTPNHLHKPHSILALQRGFHALVEKPMALSVDECDAMIEASHKYNKKIFAVKQNRYNPPVQIVHDLMKTDALGELSMIQVNCFWNRNDNYYASSSWRGKRASDGGCLFTQFSHFIDILYYLVGDIDTVSGIVNNYTHQHNTEFEDTGTFILKTKKGAIINFNFTTCAYDRNMEGSITLIGNKGVVKIGGQYLNTLEYSHIHDVELPNIQIQAKENDYGTYKGSMSNHDKVIQNVIDVLLYDKPIMTSATEGKAVVQIIEDMYEVAVNANAIRN